jgi:hypothetical protein
MQVLVCSKTKLQKLEMDAWLIEHPFAPRTVRSSVPQGATPRSPRRAYALGGGVPMGLGGR